MSELSQSIGIIAQSKLGAVLAGLSWQPVPTLSRFKQTRYLRDLADREEAARLKLVSSGGQQTVGLLSSFQVEMLEAKLVLHSLAALVASRYPGENLIYLAHFTEREGVDDTCMVVLEAGLPVMDQMMSLAQADTLVHQLLAQATQEGFSYHLCTSGVDLDVVSDVLPLTDLLAHQGLASRLTSPPSNLSWLLIGVVVVVLVVVAFFQFVYVDEDAERLKRIQALQLQSAQNNQTGAYLAALLPARTQVAYSSAELFQIRQYWATLPVVQAGWSLRQITCQKSECQLTWGNEGGYTVDLLRARGLTEANIVSVTRDTVVERHTVPDLRLHDVPDASVLPTRQAVQDMLFVAGQVWQKAGLSVDYAEEGVLWPEGFTEVQTPAATYRHRVVLRANPALFDDFIEAQAQAVLWDRFSMTLDVASGSQLIQYEAEGAWYAQAGL